MKMRSQVIFWLSVLAFLSCFLWLFSDILLPFVVGAAVAYLLNPAVGGMARRGLPRWAGSILILSGFMVVIAVALAFAVPVIYRESAQLISEIPAFIDMLSDKARPYIGALEDRFGQNIGDKAVEKVTTIDWSLYLGKAVQIGGGIMGNISFLLITPLVAFFMMSEWPRMLAFFSDNIPPRHKPTVERLARKIDQKLAGFIRGQMMVVMFLAFFYGTGLMLVGLNRGFLIGMTAGLLAIIPYFGTAFGIVTSLCVAFLQEGTLAYMAIAVSVFGVGQLIESNVLTPKLVGDSVGLHPLWIIFALMAGGTLFGLVGMLVAIPVAASVGVLIGFALEQYRASPLYAAIEPPHDPTPTPLIAVRESPMPKKTRLPKSPGKTPGKKKAQP